MLCSGKTFTMTGSPDNPGLTPKAIHELYRLIAEKKSLTVTVSTYFVELYNDSLVVRTVMTCYTNHTLLCRRVCFLLTFECVSSICILYVYTGLVLEA